MKINLITEAEHAKLVDIYNNFPALTFQNDGYEYINKSKLNENENKAMNEVIEILKKSIIGFSSFSNFRSHKKTGEIEIRIQYDWTAHDRSLGIPFTGAGYILADELLNGFKN